MTNVLSWLESSAERMPEKCAFAEPGCSLSYKNLLERSRAFGSWIAERSPAREGVALFLDKGVNTVAAMMGAVYAGDSIANRLHRRRDSASGAHQRCCALRPAP